MLAAKRWTVTIEIDEHDGRTRAHARLHTPTSDQLVGVGLARLNPADAKSRRSATSSPARGPCRTSPTTCSTWRAPTSRTP